MSTKFSKFILLLFVNLYLLPAYGQNLGNQLNPCTGGTEPMPTIQSQTIANPSINKAGFACDCKTDFFSVDTAGVIKKWSLSNNTITGGAVVLTGGHPGGLGFCGPDAASRTFYCGNWTTSNSFRYYDLNTGWTNVPVPFWNVINNGGYKEHQYYMGSPQSLHYYDGANFTQVPTGAVSFTVFDIAVDTLGRAWVFTGHSGTVTTELRIYEPTGLVNSYSISLMSSANYGAFFIDGKLHIARTVGNPQLGEIVPITISGQTATTDPPIPFPNEVFGDIADCQCITAAPAPCPDLSPVLRVLPGNIAGMSPVEFAIEVTEVNNVDTDGTNITVRMPSNQRLVFIWDIGLTTAAQTPVQNSNWNYLGDNGLFHSWIYNGPNQVIQSGATSAIGFQGFYDPQSTSGTTTFTASIVLQSGGECIEFANNSSSETLVYFD